MSKSKSPENIRVAQAWRINTGITAGGKIGVRITGRARVRTYGKKPERFREVHIYFESLPDFMPVQITQQLRTALKHRIRDAENILKQLELEV